MLKLSYFKHEDSTAHNSGATFMNLLKSKWDKIHDEPDVFRYKINNLEERLVNDKYLLQLNPDRSSNRRTPEHIDSICQPFDDMKFNFTKVSQRENMFFIESNGDEHSVLVNVSPISHYHSLLCPSVNKKLPQVATVDSLFLAIEIMFLGQECDLKIGFNSLCALASVNHLHYHMFIEKHTLPVELAKWQHIKGALHYTPDYPVPAFCFEIEKSLTNAHIIEIHRLIDYLLENSIAHNILITMKAGSAGKGAVFIWPRKSTAGVKQLTDFNVAVCELSGWFPVFSAEAFRRLQSEDLETELVKWRIDNFEALCKEVKLLY